MLSFQRACSSLSPGSHPSLLFPRASLPPLFVGSPPQQDDGLHPAPAQKGAHPPCPSQERLSPFPACLRVKHSSSPFGAKADPPPPGTYNPDLLPPPTPQATRLLQRSHLLLTSNSHSPIPSQAGGKKTQETNKQPATPRPPSPSAPERLPMRCFQAPGDCPPPPARAHPRPIHSPHTHTQGPPPPRLLRDFVYLDSRSPTPGGAAASAATGLRTRKRNRVPRHGPIRLVHLPFRHPC